MNVLKKNHDLDRKLKNYLPKNHENEIKNLELFS